MTNLLKILQWLRQIPILGDLLLSLLGGGGREEKTRILAHVMPWYSTREDSGAWGWHWTMNRFSPETVKGGRREIASKFYPLIGPYDSRNKSVVEYHLLTMKLSGVDGIVIDWYGLSDLHDYPDIHRNSTLLVDMAEKIGLSVAICYEDRTILELEKNGRLKKGREHHAAREIKWLSKNWFSRKHYLRHKGKPLLLSFGVDNMSDKEWSRTLDMADLEIAYVSQANLRKKASGVFDWPVPSRGLAAQERFAKDNRDTPLAIPVAFPRFDDIYEQAGVHSSYGRIPDDGGRTFRNLVTKAIKNGRPFVQIATWNDWGEGTSIEPSVEFNTRDLAAIQNIRRDFLDKKFPYTSKDLRLPLELFNLRKRGSVSSNDLNSVAALIAEGDLERASKQLKRLIEEGAGKS